jgi:hypothetical protein
MHARLHVPGRDLEANAGVLTPVDIWPGADASSITTTDTLRQLLKRRSEQALPGVITVALASPRPGRSLRGLLPVASAFAC